MTVKLIQITPKPEEQIAYIARVSNPKNQDNPDYAKLLAYCIKHQHWSIFEQAFMTLEIETTRGLAAQILRHRSFTFQEFSQRYADTSLMTKGSLIPIPELRRQDLKNRQNSTDDLDPEKVKMLEKEIAQHFHDAQDLYRYMIDMGVAKECARFVLPLAVPTKLYMSGSVRSWIHYIDLRSAHGTQKEHKVIAEECREIFKVQLPTVSEALGWT
tara:strand:+ start:1837 stop:2478 length:642 start_codon:yes stop_codon:yes gene_type:complete